MSNNHERYRQWALLPPSSSFEKHFKTHPHHTEYIKEFETDVTTDPFRHSVRKRIAPIPLEIKRYPKGSHRWRKSNLRIVYYPDKDDHTIYPLDAGTAGNIGYKKRS
jgi:mRNA-degrading endonuclease RelE of RelBE toxin-antitoxin system